MASTPHQLPDWELPSTSPKKPPFFSKQNFFSTSSTNQPSSKETPTEATTTATVAAHKLSLRDRFDLLVPDNRHYFGRSRKTFLLSLLALVLLLVIILGLGLGLGLKHKSYSPFFLSFLAPKSHFPTPKANFFMALFRSQDLPLPTNTATFAGDITYYSPGLGACGIVSTSSDSICAVSHIIFDAASTSSDPNSNPLCNKKIRITRYNSSIGGNRSVDVTVVDRCVGCKATDLDLSLSMFDELAEEAQGRVTASWAWLT
jgi:hypothetical protein